ncbi:unnamed protein product [Sympodiomycopsis kandeliae]
MAAKGGPQNGGPDKRTTAYENIFGRPTAKPKGPVAQPGAASGAASSPYALHPSQQQQQAYWQQQSQSQPPQQQHYAQQQRWNGPQQQQSFSHFSGGGMGGYYQPTSNYSYDPALDRRSSMAPSLMSQSSSTSSPYQSSTPYTPASSNAADYYNHTPQYPHGQTPASAYASFYTSGATGGPSDAGSSNASVSAGYINPNAHSPTSSQRHLNQGPYSDNSSSSDARQSMSSFSESVYSGRSLGQRVPSAAGSVSSLHGGSNSGGASPQVEAPRLPSIDVQGAEGQSEANWFKGLSLDGRSLNGSNSSHGKHVGNLPNFAALKPTAGQTVNEDEDFATPGPRDGGDPFATEFQTFQAQTAATDAARPHNPSNGAEVTGGATSFDSRSMRRKSSFESDRRSIANSVYTLPGGVGNGSSSQFYQSGSNAASTSNFGRTYSSNMNTGGSTLGAADMWQRAPRMRTASSATQAAQAAYSPGLADQKAVNTGRLDHRSISVGAQNGRPGLPGTSASHQSSIASANNIPPPGGSQRRGPLVYPALLSRVADAFKQRVMITERVKDGLTYKDAFDGREAVDRIAYIIKTTDRNLALLLGRALDAQKFFHDVTYDHRLRDSPNELYQFRTRLASPFGSEGEHFEDANDGYKTPSQLGVPQTPKRDSSSPSLPTSSASSIRERNSATPTPSLMPPTPQHGQDAEEEDELPTGVFTLLTDCYSPTCTRDRLCYSIACPRRLEQQARLNMKPHPVLKRSISRESLGDVKEPGALWAESVSKEVLESVPEQERKRQELINEVIYTERDFVRDLEYLRDMWIKPLRTKDIIPEARRDDFVSQVFWNVLEVHAVNSKLAELLTKRQKQQAVVERISDIFLEMVPHFSPFVKYGAHQLYGKYEFEKEKASNPAFAKFVDETERLPESRKLELNGYLTKPTTRLARYPLLLEAVIKQTSDTCPDKQALPKVIKIVKEFLTKVNVETGKSENRFNLAQLDQQLVFKQGEAVDLRLRDEQRELVFKGPLKKRGGTQSESAELQVFLFDHALLMVKAKTVHKNELYKVYRKPIPLELLIVTVYDEVPTGKGNATRPKSVMSKTSTGNRLSGGVPTGSTPKQDAKTGYALTFTYLGRKGYTLTLWASTFVGRRKWFEHIETRQDILRQRSNIFDTITLSESFFVGPNKVNCSVPFDFGRRIIYGTDDGVYLSDLREKARAPTKVLPLPGVTQIDVLEEYQILIILAERSVHTFTLDALDPSDPMGSLKRGRRISSHTSFFKAGQCLGRTLVCVVKSSSLSSTIKTLEPIEQNIRGKKQPTFRKLLQGGQETLRVFKEFYIPTESSSIHFLKTKLCVGCTKGFEIVDLETLDTQGLLDPADSSLDFVHRKETVKPIAIYRIDGEFLLCYDEFAFYVNKNGWRAKGNWIIHWEGNPTSFALHHPYVLAFESSFIEVRHVETGALHQVITGYNLRCLFADVPPPAPHGSSSAASSQISLFNGSGAAGRGAGGPGFPPMPRPPQGGPLPHGFGGPGGPIGYAGHPAGPGRPSYPGAPYANQQQQQQAMMYGGGGGGARPGGPPNMPYAFSQAPPPRPTPQRNPVWESVAASRNQIVFIGDATVFAVRLASAGNASSSSVVPSPSMT